MNRQPAQAIKALARADSLTEYTLNSTTRWYLAQAHLLNNNADAAIPILEKLVTQNREYAAEASSLLDAIKDTNQ